MKSVVLRLLHKERGLFAGALVIGAACVALGVPVDFVLFALTLAGVALFHHHTLQVALTGLAVIVLYKLGFTGFKTGPGFAGLGQHLAHEWVILTNLLGLLLGFALLSNHFEESKVPAVLPRFLPDDWKGGFVLLLMIFVLSSFLDNIAAALIGGTVAATVFRGKVHIGYLAAIVAAGVAIFIFGIPAAMQQQRYSPITRDAGANVRVDWARVAIVAFILVTAIVVNVLVNVKYGEYSDRFPFIGVGVWAAILLAALWRRPAWGLLPGAFKGSVFLLSLILCASLMPV